jgi:hypothetical protein
LQLRQLPILGSGCGGQLVSRALGRYLDEGSIEIDNSAAERAQRVVALGRKNYLFAGPDAGRERAAAIYSLLGSAKLNDLDPELYVRHVLERIADHPDPRTPAMELGLRASNASRSISSVHLKNRRTLEPHA